MWVQNLTTKEPDDSMIEVAICAVEAVFDWEEPGRRKNPMKSGSKKACKTRTSMGQPGAVRKWRSDRRVQRLRCMVSFGICDRDQQGHDIMHTRTKD